MEPEEALEDFIQIGILFILVYFGTYYLPSLNLTQRTASFREMTISLYSDVAIILLAVMQWRRARFPEVRKLYGGLALYHLIYATGSHCLDVYQAQQEIPTGTWYDLAWSIPLLYGAFWAATWQPDNAGKGLTKPRPKTLSAILITNGMFAFVPLAILFLIAQLGPGWKLLRFSLLCVSFGCYAIRIAMMQFRQQDDEETCAARRWPWIPLSMALRCSTKKASTFMRTPRSRTCLGFEDPKRIIGQPWRIVYAFQEIDKIEEEIRHSLAKTGKWSAHLSLRRPNGTQIPVEMTVTLMPDGGTLCACRDISLREQAEKARAQAEAKYRTLVEQVNAITYIAEIGIDGQWHYVSPQIESILGYKPNRQVGGAN